MSTGWIEELVEALMSKAGNVALTSAEPQPVEAASDVGVATTAARADHAHAHGNQAGGALHALASGSADGFMSASGFSKLSGIAANAAALGTATPAAVGATGIVGSSALASPIDHVHAHGNLAGGSLHAVANSSADGFAPAVGGAADVAMVSSDGSTPSWGKVTGAMLAAGAALAATQLAAGGTGNVLLGGASANSWGQIANAQVATGAAIAVSKLAGGSDGDTLVTNGSTPYWAKLADANIATAAGIAVSKLATGAANTVLLSNGTVNSFAALTNAYISASAAIAVSKLANGAAGTVLCGGSPNAFSADPSVTSLTAASYLAAGSSPAAAGTVRLPAASTIVAGTTTAVTTSETANTFNGPTSAVIAVAGTTRQTVTATTSTWNFGSADVVVGDGYVNIASTATTGKLRFGISYDTAESSTMATARFLSDTLDRRLLSMYPTDGALVVGCATVAGIKTGWNRVYFQANDQFQFLLGDYGPGGAAPKMRISSSGVSCATITSALLQNDGGSLTLTASDDLAMSAADAVVIGGTSTIIEKVNGVTKLEHTATQTIVRQRMVTTDEVVVGGAYVSIGVTPAAGGTLRLPNNCTVYARNAAGSADIRALIVGSDDVVLLGNGANQAKVYGASVATYAGSTLVSTATADRVDFEKPITMSRPTGALTIASGVITVTGGFHAVDTEGGAATDNLDTINGGDDGQILYLRSVTSPRKVVLTESGNIAIGSGTTLTIEDSGGAVTLIYTSGSSKWLVTSHVGCALA